MGWGSLLSIVAEAELIDEVLRLRGACQQQRCQRFRGNHLGVAGALDLAGGSVGDIDGMKQRRLPRVERERTQAS